LVQEVEVAGSLHMPTWRIGTRLGVRPGAAPAWAAEPAMNAMRAARGGEHA